MDLLDSIQDPHINHDAVYNAALQVGHAQLREQVELGTLSKPVRDMLADTQSQADLAGHTVGRVLGFSCSLLDMLIATQSQAGADHEDTTETALHFSLDALASLCRLRDEGKQLLEMSSTTVTSATNEDGEELEISEGSVEGFRRRLLAELRRVMPAPQRKLIASTFPSYFLQDVGGPQSLAW